MVSVCSNKSKNSCRLSVDESQKTPKNKQKTKKGDQRKDPEHGVPRVDKSYHPNTMVKY